MILIKRFWPLMTLFVVTVILMVSIQGFVRTVIVEPLLYASWFVVLILGSLSQWVFWFAFVIVAAVIAVRSLTGARSAAKRTHARLPETRGPVANWSNLLERADNQRFAKWRLSRALGKLTWQISHPEERYNQQRHLEYLLESDQATSPEIVAYFEAGHPSFQPSIRRWFSLPDQQTTALDLEPEVVVDYLERRFDLLMKE